VRVDLWDDPKHFSTKKRSVSNGIVPTDCRNIESVDHSKNDNRKSQPVSSKEWLVVEVESKGLLEFPLREFYSWFWKNTVSF
jgi:hypothetical protein